MNMKYGIIITQNKELTEALEKKRQKIADLKKKLSDTPASISTTAYTATPESEIILDQLPSSRQRPIAPKSASFLLMLKHFGLKPFNFYPMFRGEGEMQKEPDYQADLPHSIEKFMEMKPQHQAFIQTLAEFYKYEQAQRLRTEEQSFKMIEALQENATKLEGQIRNYKKHKPSGEEGGRSHSTSAIVKGAFFRGEHSPIRKSPVRPTSAIQMHTKGVLSQGSESNSAELKIKHVESTSSLDTVNFKIRQLSIINETELFKPKNGNESSDCTPMLASPVNQDY